MRQVWRLVATAVTEFFEHDAFTLAAALAFYTLLSLAPLVVFLVIALGAITPAGQQLVVNNFQHALGPRAGQVVSVILEHAATDHRLSSLSSVVSAIVLFVAATGVFVQLQAGLNRVWEVKPKPGFLLGRWLHRRAAAFMMVLVVGGLMLGSLVLGTALRLLLPSASEWVSAATILGEFGLVTVLFALLFRFLPDTEIDWKDVWVGAALTTLLVALGRAGLDLYLRYSTVTSAYGAAASSVVLLIVFYYSAAMVYLGAEMARVWAQMSGHPIRPREYAEWTQAQSGPSPVTG